MKFQWLVIVASVAGGMALVAAIFVWMALSKLSSGYEVSDGSVYWRHFNNVNWKVERRQVAEADPLTIATVSHSGGLYGTDGTHVFCEGELIADAHSGTFVVLDWREHLSHDAYHVYWKTIRMSSEPEHFEVLSRGYSKDSKQVYYASRVVEGADPATFVVTGTSTSQAKDKNYEYDMGRRK